MSSKFIKGLKIVALLAIILLPEAVSAQNSRLNSPDGSTTHDATQPDLGKTSPTDEGKFMTRQGSISFLSDAPLELIQAKSDLLYGIIDTSNGSFAFSVTVLSFEGFNSPLQQTHFNENYLESGKFPKATFSGKIVEDLDFSKEGVYSVRAKGELIIHGVKQNRIIKALLKINEGQLIVVADFNVLLEEHEIEIPQIVHQKISESIRVQLSVKLPPN